MNVRDVKYRARVLNSKNWIYRQPFHIRGTWYMYNSLWDAVPINPKTIGEFARLKDMGGKDIYQGDIIRIFDDAENDVGWNEEVIFHRGCFMAGDDNLLVNVNFRCKVIGNSFENPELLER